MISHKKSLITNFGHKHKIKNFIKKNLYFSWKKFNCIWILVHIWNQISNSKAKILQKWLIKFEKMAIVTKKCYYSNISKAIYFFFYSRSEYSGVSTNPALSMPMPRQQAPSAMSMQSQQSVTATSTML